MATLNARSTRSSTSRVKAFPFYFFLFRASSSGSSYTLCVCVCAWTNRVRSCSIEPRVLTNSSTRPYVRRRDVASHLKTATTYDMDVTKFSTRVNNLGYLDWKIVLDTVPDLLSLVEKRGIFCFCLEFFSDVRGECQTLLRYSSSMLAGLYTK